ncbi:MAG: hypothetical protein H6719_22090 [Sandaracinaceae bacterium]|nr:hypothetical protein [Sandaracinaceae bacterium]
MGQTLYSHALRILTCAQCGAPLDASAEGGRFTCAYCSAVSSFARRDESADLSAASAGRAADVSEQERYARLRQQDRQPAAIPDAIAALLVDGHLPEDRVANAEAQWRDVRSQIAITPSFPVCERFFHLTVILAPHFDERRRRAALETAVELLPDAGHRHVLRCMLAREAARARDFTAAEAWLAPANPRPTDLEQDTAYRLAAATLASARGDYPKVVELLGFGRDDVPLENRTEVACWILRIDALEHLGREADAIAEMNDLVKQWGVDRIRHTIGLHAPLTLCERSFGDAVGRAAAKQQANARGSAEAEVRAIEVKLEQLSPSYGRLFSQLMIGTAILTFLFGSVWTCVLTGMIETDPLFGMHARVLCPRICDDCVPPYLIESWSTTTNGNNTSSSTNIYCSDAAGRMVGMEANNQLWLDAVNGAPWLDRYEVPGGMWTMWFTIMATFAPFMLVIVFALKLRGALARREQRARVALDLEAARANRARFG